MYIADNAGKLKADKDAKTELHVILNLVLSHIIRTLSGEGALS